MELKKQVSAGGTIKESSEVAALKRKFARLLKENMDLKQQNEMMQGFVDDATAELEASGDATKLLVATEMALEEAVTRLVLNGLDK
jgi:regulator of replication initiation timing